MIKAAIRRVLARFGYNLTRKEPPRAFPVDFDSEAIDIIAAVRPYTMTSDERIFVLIEAVRYLAKTNVEGGIVECGVWRGGSMMAVAHALAGLDRRDVDLYLFDTFEGMTEPQDVDLDYRGVSAHNEFARSRTSADASDWCRAEFGEVESNLISTGYPRDRIKLIRGKVEQTIPSQAPSKISLLRLDTDWYESTIHELVHLYPRLSSRGVLIIDDYGHWMGSRRATDEYFATLGVSPVLLNRIDYTGRVGVKP